MNHKKNLSSTEGVFLVLLHLFQIDAGGRRVWTGLGPRAGLSKHSKLPRSQNIDEDKVPKSFHFLDLS
jgi:hypothetical protein